MNTLLSIAGAIGPIFLLIALGYGLKSGGFLKSDQWQPVERFAVYLLYPGFLIPAIWHADLIHGQALSISGAVMGAALVAGALGLGLRPLLNLSGPSFTSVFQGMVRFNSFVFIPVIASLYGPKILGLASVAISALIPVVNLLSILVLAHWGEPEGDIKTKTSLKSLGISLITNPIFAACIIGLVLNFSGMPPIDFLEKPLKMLGEAAIPTGLILAGAGLSFDYMSQKPWLISLVSGFKLLLMPIMSWALCKALGGDSLAQAVALGCGATPSAAAAYVMARHMGGDAPLMAGIIALTTLGSLFTMPLLLWVFHLG